MVDDWIEAIEKEEIGTRARERERGGENEAARLVHVY
jgi:hypothetical protein